MSINPAYSLTTHFHSVRCATCYMVFYLPDHKYNACQNKNQGFYCPDGHSSVFTETELTKIKNELERTKQQKQWAEDARNFARKDLEKERKRSAALKGVVTKTRNRISNGVCPCCSRSFQNLKRHMDCKHPEFKKDVE